MQLLENPISSLIREKHAMNVLDGSCDSFKQRDLKTKSSNAMNPVASGDNVTTGLSSPHKLKEDLPPLIPCCEGRELEISVELVHSGLSAISVKHDALLQSLSMSQACEQMQVPPGIVTHRNSFRSLHRPDLKRVPYLRRMNADELKTLFQGYAGITINDVPNGHKENLEAAQVNPLSTARSKKTEAKSMEVPREKGTQPLHPISETKSGAEDIPAGKRLHGARAKLYTSVLAGTKTGDQLDGVSEEYDVPPEDLTEDEVQLKEEIQIILPPRDEITAESYTSSGQ